MLQGVAGSCRGPKEVSRELLPPFPLPQIPKYKVGLALSRLFMQWCGRQNHWPSLERLISKDLQGKVVPGIQDVTAGGAKAAGSHPHHRHFWTKLDQRESPGELQTSPRAWSLSP